MQIHSSHHANFMDFRDLSWCVLLFSSFSSFSSLLSLLFFLFSSYLFSSLLFPSLLFSSLLFTSLLFHSLFLWHIFETEMVSKVCFKERKKDFLLKLAGLSQKNLDTQIRTFFSSFFDSSKIRGIDSGIEMSILLIMNYPNQISWIDAKENRYVLILSCALPPFVCCRSSRNRLIVVSKKAKISQISLSSWSLALSILLMLTCSTFIDNTNAAEVLITTRSACSCRRLPFVSDDRLNVRISRTGMRDFSTIVALLKKPKNRWSENVM